MNVPTFFRRITRGLTSTFALLAITSQCVGEDEVVIHFKANRVVESEEFGTQVFDPSDEQSLADIKAKVKGRSLVALVDSEVPFTDLTALQEHFSKPDVKMKKFLMTRTGNPSKSAARRHETRDEPAVAVENHRATERLSKLFDERQAVQLEKIELQMRKLEALKRKVELRAKRKAEIVAKQVEASLGHDKSFERDSHGVVSMIYDPTNGSFLTPEGKARSTPRSATSYSKVDIRLRKNDLEIAEVKLARAITKFDVLKPAFERNQVSRIEFQDAEYDVQQAKLEVNRAKILLEEASHQDASDQRRPNQDQTKFMQRLLENQLQQANAMADKQSQLAAMAKTRYEAGTTTLESVVEAQANHQVARLEVEKIQMQLEAVQRGVPYADMNQLPDKGILPSDAFMKIEAHIAGMKQKIAELSGAAKQARGKLFISDLIEARALLEHHIEQLQGKQDRTDGESQLLQDGKASLARVISELTDQGMQYPSN